VYCPVRVDEFNYDQYVVTDIGNCEIVEVVEYFDGKFSEIKLSL